MKPLQECLFEIDRKLTIHRLWKELKGAITEKSLYTIQNDPSTNIRMSTASLIFDITKNKFGRGLRPWEYLMNIQDWSKNEVKFGKR